MIYVLDTDHLSVLERGGAGAVALEMHLGEIPPDDLATTIVTYEEQVRGWMARAASTHTEAQIIESYARLHEHVDTFAGIQILRFDEAAARRARELFVLKIRIGTMDRRIAAIALAHDAVLLTRNVTDFEKVPGLRIEDWTL